MKYGLFFLLINLASLSFAFADKNKPKEPFYSTIVITINNETNYSLTCGPQANMTYGRIFLDSSATYIAPHASSGKGFDGIFATTNANNQAVGSFQCAVLEPENTLPVTNINLFFEYGLRKATLGHLITAIKLNGFAQANNKFKITIDKSHAFRTSIEPPHLTYIVSRI